jgi:hypothetical protein
MENTKQNNDEINIIVKEKKPTSEAMKKAKAKYYQKKKLDEAYMQDMRNRAFTYYHTMNPYALKKEKNENENKKRLKEIDVYFPKIITE